MVDVLYQIYNPKSFFAFNEHLNSCRYKNDLKVYCLQKNLVSFPKLSEEELQQKIFFKKSSF